MTGGPTGFKGALDMASAALSIASGTPRPRRSTSRRADSSSSASSRAANAVIQSFKQGHQWRNRAADNGVEESAVSRGVETLTSNVAATVDSFGMPRWFLLGLALAGVGLVLTFAVINTLPLLARHAVSGITTLDGKPLGRVTLTFQKFGGPPKPSAVDVAAQTILTAADGSFHFAAAAGLPSGTYTITVRPAESAAPIPTSYKSSETTPLRFEILEDLSGLQVSIRRGQAPAGKHRK